MKSSYLCLAVATLACTPALAHSAEWDHTMLIYLLGAGLDGKSQVGAIEADIDQSFSDILEHLDVGGMGTYRASGEIWTHTIDAIYTGLSGNAPLGPNGRFGAEVDQLIASYDIGYRLAERVEVVAGVRYNSIDVDLAVTTFAGTMRTSGDKDWLDPYIGARSIIPFNDTFGLTLHADVGGFGIGSDLAWQAVVWLNWNMSKTFFGAIGYRILDTDYEDSSGNRFFKFDVAIHGPGLGFGWRFR
jgi:hypothetical protein